MLLDATVCRLVLVLSWVVVESQYDNEFDPYFRLKCPKNNIMSFIGSVRYDEHEHREWTSQCKRSPGATKACEWTSYIGGLNKPLRYSCKWDMVLNGMRTYASKGNIDRPFMVQCCGVYRKVTTNCYYTDFVNDWGGEMRFDVPDGRAIKGVYSVYDNAKEDRRWQFYVCDLV